MNYEKLFCTINAKMNYDCNIFIFFKCNKYSPTTYDHSIYNENAKTLATHTVWEIIFPFVATPNDNHRDQIIWYFISTSSNIFAFL